MTILSEIKKYVKKTFSYFSHNKRLQIIRLLYEIQKKEKCDFRTIIKEKGKIKFSTLKNKLVSQRFSQFKNNKIAYASLSLTELKIHPEDQVTLQKKFEFSPENIFIEESVSHSLLAKKIQLKFPKAQYQNIHTYTDYVTDKKCAIKNYNNRKNNIFIIKENFDFFMPCPCSKGAVNCNYHNFKLGHGCPFECTYCFLQSYTNSAGITLPANIDDFFSKFNSYQRNVRLGSGQFTDSLAFDHITEYSPLIVNFFRKHKNNIFEFKTKSNNIKLLKSVKASENIIISWSLNPENIINTNEFYTSKLMERLHAAAECAEYGYKVAFHFDPIIFYKEWENDYEGIVHKIFDLAKNKSIAYISLGSLRMTQNQKQIIENRFPNNKILDEELYLGFDNKLRYSLLRRESIYKKMKKWIRAYSQEVPIYLCMEKKSLYDSCKIQKNQI